MWKVQENHFRNSLFAALTVALLAVHLLQFTQQMNQTLSSRSATAVQIGRTVAVRPNNSYL